MTGSVLIQFPGLGSYEPGILAEPILDSRSSGTILSEVDKVAAEYRLGPVSRLLTDRDGPDAEELARTPTLLHLASFTSTCVLYQALRARGIEGDVLLGHSTGEITALAASGALSVADAARVLCEREVALETARTRGGLVAVQAGARRAESLCGAAGGWSLAVSLVNSPEQTVVSGTDADLPGFEAVTRAAGVHATRLLVRYPHHNPVLRPAAVRVAEAAGSYRITDPAARVFSPLIGRFVTGAADARRIVDRHLTDPVDYLSAIRILYDDFGVRRILEVGARSVLTESARQTLPAGSTLLGAPPAARSAAEILDALTDAAGQKAPAVPTASPATAPVATPAPSTDEVVPTLPNREDLLARLRSAFAGALGYPEDVFTEDAHLEADLGISSVKKTELLVGLLDELQLPTPPAQVRMRDYTTLPKLAGLLETLSTDRVAT